MLKEKQLYGNQREAVLLAYMAGILDGEGCFSITKTKPSDCINPRYTGRVMIGMTDKEVISLFYEKFGGSMLIERVQNRKPIYRWKLVGDSERVINFLEKIIPYLICKKPQAEILLEYVKTKKISGYQKNKGLPIEELHRREDFYLKIKELKR